MPCSGNLLHHTNACHIYDILVFSGLVCTCKNLFYRFKRFLFPSDAAYSNSEVVGRLLTCLQRLDQIIDVL